MREAPGSQRGPGPGDQPVTGRGAGLPGGGRSRIAALSDDFARDLRHALRLFRKSPGFVVSAILPLALGVSATTAVWGIVNGLLLRPFPVPGPDRLFAVQESRRGPNVGVSMFLSTLEFWRYLEWRDAATPGVLDGLAAQNFDQFSLRREGGAETVSGYVVSGNYFDVLGLQPQRGRFFDATRDGTGVGDPAVVLSDEFWGRRFKRAESVLDSVLYINGRALPVVGIAPAGFQGTLGGIVADVWIPAETYMQPLPGEARSRSGGMRFGMFGRLRAGMTAEQGTSAMMALSAQVPPDNPQVTVLRVRLDPLRPVPSMIRTTTIGFAGALFLTALSVLLVAVFNVGGLLLARAATRRQEVAVRLAIGASRGRLVRQLLTEGSVLFAAAGLAGILFARWLMDLMSLWQPPIGVRIFLDVRLDVVALTIALAISLGIGIVFSLVPAFQGTHAPPAAALKHGGAWTVQRSRTRNLFVIGQLAVSMVLLIAAGLFARALQAALSADTGFESGRVAFAVISPGSHGYVGEDAVALFDRLAERMKELPDIEAIGYGHFLPLTQNNNGTRVHHAGIAGDEGVAANYGLADAGWFETVSVPIIAGRPLVDADRTGPLVVVINQTLAERLWPGEQAIGRDIEVNGQIYSIAGVARNGHYESLNEAPRAYVFLPLREQQRSSRMIYVRGRTSAMQALETLRRTVASLDPDIALEQAGELSDFVRILTVPQRIAATMVGIFGLAGLLLAAIGIYGIVAYQVAQRAREFGIRRALGATGGDVARIVLRHGLVLALIGGLAGVLLSIAGTRLTASFLGSLAPPDAMPFIAVPLILGAIALLASWMPARRAAKIDPMRAMRTV